MGKQKWMFFFAVISLLIIVTVPVYAWENDQQSGRGDGELEGKLLWKISTLLAHQEMLNLKKEQIKQINDLLISTKKGLIRSNADIEIVAIDIKSNLFDTDKIDLKAMDKLLDQKYNAKKDKAKMIVKGFAQIQNILTKEQLDMLKDISLESGMRYHKGIKFNPEKTMGMCPQIKASEPADK